MQARNHDCLSGWGEEDIPQLPNKNRATVGIDESYGSRAALKSTVLMLREHNMQCQTNQQFNNRCVSHFETVKRRAKTLSSHWRVSSLRSSLILFHNLFPDSFSILPFPQIIHEALRSFVFRSSSYYSRYTAWTTAILHIAQLSSDGRSQMSC